MKIDSKSFWLGFIFFGLIIVFVTILFLIIPNNYVENTLLENNNSVLYISRVGLYKELNDDGFSNETYLLNNTSFEVVRID